MSFKQTFHNSEKLITLAFHKMQASFSYGVNNYSLRRFEKLLKYLTENGYTFVSIHEIGGELKDKSVLITFDDGYAHLHTYLPQFMKKFDIKPLIFIPTKQIGKSNNWDYSHVFQNCPHMDSDMIKELSASGVDFGSHSHTHCDLTALTINQLKKELSRSKEILENLIDQEINSISYPFGRFNKNIISQVRDTGFRYGFSMKFPDESDYSLTIGRYPIYGFDTIFTITQKIEHGMLYQCERIKSLCVSNLSGGTVLLNKLRKIK